MHIIDIPSKNIKIRIASCIEEMTPDDFICMMKLLHRHKNGEITECDFRTLLIMQMMKVRKTVTYHRMTEQQREIIHDNLNRVIDLLDSFFTSDYRDGQEIKALNLKFIRNMIPRIGKLWGPADALHDVSFYEYKEAFNCYTDFNTSKDEKSLDEMIAILYRPKRKFLWFRQRLPNFDGHNRILFTSKSNPRLLQKRIRKIAHVPVHIKTGVYLWFSGCVDYLRNGKPLIDGHEIDLSILYRGSDSNSTPSIGLSGLLFSLSENKVFGDLFDTANSNLYDIMARLYQLKVEYDNQLAKTKTK